MTEVNIEEEIDHLEPVSGNIREMDEHTSLTAPIGDQINKTAISKAANKKSPSPMTIKKPGTLLPMKK